MTTLIEAGIAVFGILGSKVEDKYMTALAEAQAPFSMPLKGIGHASSG
jgi:hypothetical protein